MSDSDVIDFILFPVVFELLHPFEFIDRYNLVSLEFINNISRKDIGSDHSGNSSTLTPLVVVTSLVLKTYPGSLSASGTVRREKI